MKPEGLKPIRFPGKTDCHPKKGWKNWWACLGFKSTRSSRKQKLKGYIIKEIEDSDNIMGFWDFWE